MLVRVLYLSQFNLQIHFRPGRLGTKPDALTHHSDVHLGSGTDTTPTNVRPLFILQQLDSPTFCAGELDDPPGGLSETLDQLRIWTDISKHLPGDTFAQTVKGRIRDQHPLPGWELQDEHLWFEECIYIPKPLCIQLIHKHHDHPMAGHFGHHKTINLIHRSYHWPGLTRAVKQYIRSCMVCAHSKANQHKPYGFLKQLPIPPRPWESISMDFIEQLLTLEGNTAILVIVDCLTKQSLFIPTHDSIDLPELAQLFLTHVFSKHGTLSHVTSDQGSEFVSHFFRSLGKLLWMELHFTSGYHPEGDGQTEWLNQVLEQYLRAYTNYQQDDWSSLLPLAAFAYNNAMNEMTRISLFFANKGYHPSLVAELNVQVSSIGAQCFISDLDDLHMELKQSIAKAQQRYQKYADEHCSLAPLLKIGDQVYVKAKYFCTTQPSKELSKKNLGPYKVITIPSSHSFTLCLPQHFCSVHPIFHISQLELAEPDPF